VRSTGERSQQRIFHHPLMSHSLRYLFVVLLIAALFRTWLIQNHGVSFDSDEAVVGLMARHINQGKPIPTFFYGQDYMGSLDALLVAVGFRVCGESIQTIRLVQMALYLLSLITAWGLAYTVTRSRRVAGMTLLLLAIPTALGTVYTAIALGGYNEIVLFGNVILLLGWQVTVEGRREDWRWALLGLMAGLGWWTNGAIVTPCLAVGVLGLRHFSPNHWRRYGLAAAGFLIGSSPWWVYNLQHNGAALSFLLDGFGGASDHQLVSPGESMIGLFVLGFSALYGLRFPWDVQFHATVGMVLGALVYLALVVDGIAGLWARQRVALQQPGVTLAVIGRRNLPGINAHYWTWLVFGAFISVFAFSSFSDGTGRYLMPLWVPAAMGVALGLERLRRGGWMIAAAALGILLVMHASSVIRATQLETGLTPQLVERLRAPAGDDDALLAFLEEEGYTRGYASYWTSFRVMFRARERVILDTALPYDERGVGENDNRYQPYVAEVKRAERVAWITQNFAELDRLIAAQLDEAGITYQIRDIGRYKVYYDFSERVAPADFDLNVQQSANVLNKQRVCDVPSSALASLNPGNSF